MEVPYIHDIKARFEAGHRIDDKTVELLWVSVAELEYINMRPMDNYLPHRSFTNYVLELLAGQPKVITLFSPSSLTIIVYVAYFPQLHLQTIDSGTASSLGQHTCPRWIFLGC